MSLQNQDLTPALALPVAQKETAALSWGLLPPLGNLDAYITAISKHYATDPDYASKIITLAHGPHVTAAIAQARGQG